jgi:hypothetical protein
VPLKLFTRDEARRIAANIRQAAEAVAQAALRVPAKKLRVGEPLVFEFARPPCPNLGRADVVPNGNGDADATADEVIFNCVFSAGQTDRYSPFDSRHVPDC